MFTPAELEKKGVKDFQLDYALKTLKRLGTKGTNVASASPPKRP
jgi:carboxyl-terminal processing protease